MDVESFGSEEAESPEPAGFAAGEACDCEELAAGAICVSRDGPGGCAGWGEVILSNPGSGRLIGYAAGSEESILREFELASEMPTPEAGADGADPTEFSLVIELEPREPGLDASPAILVILKPSLSIMGLLPNDDEGDGSG